jgi:glycosyltransferase involved in cell wall biosynthesis
MNPNDSHEQSRPTRKGKFRVGIWCDYVSHTKLPYAEGIGVFIASLIEGLLEQPENIELRILVRPGETEAYAEYPRRFGTRVQVLPAPPSEALACGNPLQFPYWEQRATRFLRKYAHRKERVFQRRKAALTWLGDLNSHFKKLPLAMLLAIAPLWLVAIAYRLIGGTLVSLMYRAELWYFSIVKRLAQAIAPLDEAGHEELSISATPNHTAQEADCDIWIVPYGVLPTTVKVPNVVFVHDLVTKHFPDAFDSDFAERVNHLIQARAADATLVACMSNFILEEDLLGQLSLPMEKTRMVPAVPPAALPEVTDAQASQLVGDRLANRKFILWPAAFRPYKGHRELLQAVALLRDKYGVEDFEIVFTGNRADGWPGHLDLYSLCQKLRLLDRVHIVGNVSRDHLSGLYRKALALVAPTRFEQSSFPVFEALAARCPVACSRIPPLTEQCATMGDAMRYFDPLDPESIASAILAIHKDPQTVADQQWKASRKLRERNWLQAGAEWLAIFKEAAAMAAQRRRKLVEGPPNGVRPANASRISSVVPVTGRRQVLIIQQMAYWGGVWQATKNLMHSLVQAATADGRLDLVLGVLPEQQGCEELLRELPQLRIARITPKAFKRHQLAAALGNRATVPEGDPNDKLLFFTGENGVLLESDAWLAVVDRFDAPLAPLRPYSVLIHDMIQRHVPEHFDKPEWHRMVREGMFPTAVNADVIFTTTPRTAEDVMAEYGIAADKIQVIPLAHDPVARFAGLSPKTVAGIRRPLILNVANAAPHKGAEVLLRGFAKIKQRPAWKDWQLAICGWATDSFSKHCQHPVQDPHIDMMRAFIPTLGLEEGRDVVFLGYIDDSQLKYLFDMSNIVINAARFDNGSFSMVEGAWFGKPVVCSRYPAAEYVDERFGIGSHFFEVNQPERLAEAFEQARKQLTRDGYHCANRSEHVVREEVRLKRFGERLCNALTDLASGQSPSIATGKSKAA